MESRKTSWLLRRRVFVVVALELSSNLFCSKGSFRRSVCFDSLQERLGHGSKIFPCLEQGRLCFGLEAHVIVFYFNINHPYILFCKRSHIACNVSFLLRKDCPELPQTFRGPKACSGPADREVPLACSVYCTSCHARLFWQAAGRRLRGP